MKNVKSLFKFFYFFLGNPFIGKPKSRDLFAFFSGRRRIWRFEPCEERRGEKRSCVGRRDLVCFDYSERFVGDRWRRVFATCYFIAFIGMKRMDSTERRAAIQRRKERETAGERRGISRTGRPSRTDWARTRIAIGVLASAAFGAAVGCSTPTFSTDNKLLLYLPGAAPRSDAIPGVMKPAERVKRIEEKGVRGRKASAEEKDALLLQLSQEYETSSSPNIRRASFEAIAKISENYRNPVAEKIYRNALEADDLSLALSACDAWGDYCRASANADADARRLGVELLADKYRRLPFSIAAGSEEENKRKKDLRVAILRNLGKFKKDDSPLVLETLKLGIDGEKLDDGALQNAAMTALGESTGKVYGLNAETWLEYLAFERGETSAPPPELSTAERLPRLDAKIINATGIFK